MYKNVTWWERKKSKRKIVEKNWVANVPSQKVSGGSNLLINRFQFWLNFHIFSSTFVFRAHPLRDLRVRKFSPSIWEHRRRKRRRSRLHGHRPAPMRTKCGLECRRRRKGRMHRCWRRRVWVRCGRLWGTVMVYFLCVSVRVQISIA